MTATLISSFRAAELYIDRRREPIWSFNIFISSVRKEGVLAGLIVRILFFGGISLTAKIRRLEGVEAHVPSCVRTVTYRQMAWQEFRAQFEVIVKSDSLTPLQLQQRLYPHVLKYVVQQDLLKCRFGLTRFEALQHVLEDNNVSIMDCFSYLSDKDPRFLRALKVHLLQNNCGLIHHTLMNYELSAAQQQEVIGYFLGLEPRAVNTIHKDYKSPLEIAVNHSSYDNIKYLIEYKAEIGERGTKLLNDCAFLGDIKSMQFFLNRGATITGRTFHAAIKGNLNLTHNGAIDGNGGPNSRGNHHKALKWIKRHLTEFDHRQASLQVRRDFSDDEVFGNFLVHLYPQTRALLRQVDLLPKNNILIQRLRHLEASLWGLKVFVLDICLLIRDYAFPSFLVVGNEHQLDYTEQKFKELNICPQLYILPTLPWLRLRQLVVEPPTIWTESPSVPGGCSDHKGQPSNEWLSTESLEWNGNLVRWDCYHCPCGTHQLHGHSLSLVNAMEIVGFYDWDAPTLLLTSSKDPHLAFFERFLEKYQGALNWEIDNIPSRRSQECYGYEEKDLLDLARTKLLKAQSVQQQLKDKVRLWSVHNAFRISPDSRAK